MVLFAASWLCNIGRSLKRGIADASTAQMQGWRRTYLVQVDNWLPEVVLLLVEVSHADLSKVTGMVLVDVGSVVVLTTGHTSTTWMLAVLSDTTVTSGHMAATIVKDNVSLD